MSYLRSSREGCGRYAKKPNESDENPSFDDDTSIPLQDQIDNLRAKISLKEKYNKALLEEVSETNAGAATMITELTELNQKLREDLQHELRAEQFAVKKALRSYRLFQLAVSEKDAEYVINWLDDKIFDACKTLNEGLHRLRIMQNKLQEAETQVIFLESCPVPGTEPWERKAEDDRIALESAIENTKATRDACKLLNNKYREILVFLKGERGKWPHMMANMERSLNQLKKELAGLEVMLDDANRFRDEAFEKMKLVEEEASANRKQRRGQMNKMKKSVEKALDANTAKYQTKDNPKERTSITGRALDHGTSSTFGQADSTMMQQKVQEMKVKQAQVLDYEERANKIVDIMRVPDLRYCPKRLKTVRKVTEVLNEELALKEEMRQMQLILEHFRYTGIQEEEEFAGKCVEKEQEIAKKEDEVQHKEKERHLKGTTACDLRFSLLSVEEMFNQGKKKPLGRKQEDIRLMMKKISEKVQGLVDSVEGLRKEFPEGSQPQRSYAAYVKLNVHARLVRVGGAEEVEVDDDSDPDADLIDSKVPNREELKSRSDKFYAQALLRKGIR
ncbi:hypothetical protein Ocin01_10595 [Orchesella cincta]|uniref:Uncharacterized protein n=1 Tax=Orchesella cincta TaxID=48709 RepID=A0A1D2MSI3_ORCCI|nr:hypothetical protein Ocin01_10595 [Orchesella cincta]